MQTHKVLIANRGEIAARIIRTCRERGILTVAVYSEADLELPYVLQADEAVCIGPPPVVQSYLCMDKILDAAAQTGATAIHPGYGLLSENASFAQKVEEQGLLWIGPHADVIKCMGDKVKAREIMMKADVPVVPGTQEVADQEDALKAAEKIGYPILLKASAGGGGVGMQVCFSPEDMKKYFGSVQGKAKAYFGDKTLFLEKWIDQGRHVEVQIAGDSHGNLIHLYERECSVQRRNQKVIEESRSPSITHELRSELFDTALRAACAVGYIGVGTVEFLVDKEDRFYFLEMNTRLQVEHPVTECITGIDLVGMQLDIANGMPLTGKEIECSGHAMEFRIYAEDPTTMLPSPGNISRFEVPHGEGIRIDAGVSQGNTVSPFYDPMIAKCIICGVTREEVMKKAKEALSSFHVEGIKTNIPLLLRVLEDPSFVLGRYTTQILSQLQVKVGG